MGLVALSGGEKSLKEIGKGLHESAEYSQDPHKALKDFAQKALEGISIGPAKVLVATYRQKERTKGGIILSSNYREEDKFQGVVGMVLKMGGGAFEDSGTVKFYGFKPEQFSWVVYKPESGRATELYGLHCRIIEDIHIDAMAADPEIFW